MTVSQSPYSQFLVLALMFCVSILWSLIKMFTSKISLWCKFGVESVHLRFIFIHVMYLTDSLIQSFLQWVGGLYFSVFLKTLQLLMGLNITVGIHTPTYTGQCNCNGFIWFMWKWNPWLLTAMNSPLSRISQPTQSDTLKYTFTISHFETNPTESMGC